MTPTPEQVEAILALIGPEEWAPHVWHYTSIGEMEAAFRPVYSNAPESPNRRSIHAVVCHGDNGWTFPAVTGNGPLAHHGAAFLAASKVIARAYIDAARDLATVTAERDQLQAAHVCIGCGVREGAVDEDGPCATCGETVVLGSVGAIEGVEELRAKVDALEWERSDLGAALHVEQSKVHNLTVERDEARQMLGRCYVASGEDTDGNDWRHLWDHAADAVEGARKRHDEDSEEDGRWLEALRVERDEARRQGEAMRAVVLALADGCDEADRVFDTYAPPMSAHEAIMGALSAAVAPNAPTWRQIADALRTLANPAETVGGARE